MKYRRTPVVPPGSLTVQNPLGCNVEEYAGGEEQAKGAAKWRRYRCGLDPPITCCALPPAGKDVGVAETGT